MQTITDPATHAALWKRARAMFARATAAIGEPAAMATRAALLRETKHEIAGWLARLESIVRKLLLAIAAGLVQEERSQARASGLVIIRTAGLQARTCSSPTQCGPEGPRPKSQLDPAHPESWPAPFALAPPRDPYAVPESRAPRIRPLWGPTPPAPPPQQHRAPKRSVEPALRFAFRLEALRRVLADPIPHARRLLRLFRRLIRRYPQAAHRFSFAPARPCVADPGDPRLVIDAMALANTAAYALDDTS